MRVIFVPVADRPECTKALRTAFDLAQQLGANICGCHIRPHEFSKTTLSRGRGVPSGIEAAWERACAGNESRECAVAARDLFVNIAEQHNFKMIKKPGRTPGAYWIEKVGSPDKVLASTGPVSDLIIVSRPKRKGGKLAHIFMLSAVLNSSRPVLVLPQAGKSSNFRCISIAWNQSPEAARAVAASMPLLRLAEQVSILTNGPERGIGPKSVQLATYLGFWGVKARRITVHAADDAKALIHLYRDSQSDLLVMGGYSRSRLRQQIFGGVTEYMLHHANIPVFMLHT
jgi:hypothetical protein